VGGEQLLFASCWPSSGVFDQLDLVWNWVELHNVSQTLLTIWKHTSFFSLFRFFFLHLLDRDYLTRLLALGLSIAFAPNTGYEDTRYILRSVDLVSLVVKRCWISWNTPQSKDWGHATEKLEQHEYTQAWLGACL